MNVASTACMSLLADRNRRWFLLALSAVLGILVALAGKFWGSVIQWPGHLWDAVVWAYNWVGIVIVGLTPLAVWLSTIVYRQVVRVTRADEEVELDYDFIARQATGLGLLGTIISLTAACLMLSGEAAKGSSAAVLRIIPLVGQAVVSTAVGLVISMVAQCFQHALERRRLRTEQTGRKEGDDNEDQS